MADYEVVIAGGGITGASFALAIESRGLTLALVEAWPPQPAPPGASFDSRVYAISPAGAAFLETVGIWRMLDPARVCPIHAMAVWGDAGARLDFNADDCNVAELGYIVESAQILAALWRRLNERPGVDLLSPAQMVALRWGEEHAGLSLADGRELTAKLIVAADGGDSWVRSQASIDIHDRAYNQMGVVANFATQLSHHNVARQWFRADGVLAWLPLPANAVSMVWSTSQDHARYLLNLDPGELSKRVQEAGQNTLGAMELTTPPAGFPLRLMWVSQLVRPRLALIGDAAHTIHPLAGQGVNLGLQDGSQLAHTLITRGPVTDCGDYGLLRRYERARKESVLAMQVVTDGLQTLFSRTAPGLRALRNLGLEMTNRQMWLKRQLIRYAMG